MDLEDTYGKLYDEVVERTGDSLYVPEHRLNTGWDSVDTVEQKAVELNHPELREKLDEYSETLEEYRRLDSRLRDISATDDIPAEMVEGGDQLGSTVPTRYDNVTRRLQSLYGWCRDNSDAILEADGPGELRDRLVESAVEESDHDSWEEYRETHHDNRRSTLALYTFWEEEGLDWNQYLWDFVDNPETGVRETVEEMDRVHDEVVSYADELAPELDAAIEAELRPGLRKRVRERIWG